MYEKANPFHPAGERKIDASLIRKSKRVNQ